MRQSSVSSAGLLAHFAHLWMPVLLALGLVEALRETSPGPFGPRFGLPVLLLGVFVVYTADRLLEPKRVPTRAWTFLACAAACACVPLAYFFAVGGTTLQATVLCLAPLCLLYPRLKRYAAPKIAAVAAAWELGCVSLGALPAAHGGLPWRGLLQPIGLSLGLAVAAGTVLCDLKDVEHDVDSGVRTFAVLWGVRGACVLAAAIALLGMCLAALDDAWALLAANAFMFALSTRPALVSRRLLGPTLVDAALAAPGLTWGLATLCGSRGW